MSLAGGIIFSIVACGAALLIGCRTLQHLCRESRLAERNGRHSAGVEPWN